MASEAPTTTALDARIAALVKDKEAEAAKEPQKVHSFNRILLKFPFIAKTLRKIRKVFNEFDDDSSGKIEYDELTKVMEKLGSSCGAAEIKDVFVNSDFHKTEGLTFREFVVSLALGYLLGDIPVLSEAPVHSSSSGEAVAEANAKQAALDSGSTADFDEEQPSQRSRRSQTISRSQVKKLQTLSDSELKSSLLGGDGAAVAYCFTLVLEAFFYFDTKHTGCIRKEELSQSMDALTQQGGAKGMTPAHHSDAIGFLTEERYAELDWDGDGSVTFKEFLFAFMAWVGLDDDEDSEQSQDAP